VEAAAASEQASAPPAAAVPPATPDARPAPPPRPAPAPLATDFGEDATSRPEPPPRPTEKVPIPNLREELSPELEDEIAAALGDESLDEILGAEGGRGAAILPTDARVRGRVVSVHNEDVFLDLGGRNEGLVSVRQFAETPAVGAIVECVIRNFDPEEGLYHVSLPGATADVADWSELTEGLLVEAVITGHNKGGLECEVNKIRGFIPAGQIDLYRVEDFEQFKGQRMACVVTEANPDRRNLVLSRRAAQEREQAEKREKTLAELAEGQVREGIVRNVRDFGAFVDLGGVDGLVHVSQLGWQRVKHPSEVLEVGQTVKVKVRKIDPETGKISLSLRDLLDNPWDIVAHTYPVSSETTGTVTKIMDFGVFVQLDSGIEGLVHISELSHKRVFRASDVVKVGDVVNVKVTSVDPEKQRIGLSMKALEFEAAPVKSDVPEEDDAPAPPLPKPSGPLKGGIGGKSGGEQFGLKW